MPAEPSDHLDDEFAQVADHASIGLIRFDAQFRVRMANLAAHHALGRRPGSLTGRSIMETFLDHRLEAMVRAAAHGQAGLRELTSPEGNIIVRAQLASGGGAWVTLENISELQRLRRIRSEFIDNLSHELRTPLANVRLLTEMLMDDLAEADVPARVRERIATIDVETGHLVQMINELLDLSRMEHAATQVRRDEVALAPLVAGSLQRLQTFAQRQGVTLRAQLPPDLPPVRGDEERLDQLLMNLLHNAIKFSHVFERFYKVDRARQRGLGGTGLGLAIARHIAEAHGGRIWLESVEGEGSTFSFSLPFA
jgi:two-component system, OmpR family, phosphate regulon sensor histidine kinase PhoR